MSDGHGHSHGLASEMSQESKDDHSHGHADEHEHDSEVIILNHNSGANSRITSKVISANTSKQNSARQFSNSKTVSKRANAFGA